MQNQQVGHKGQAQHGHGQGLHGNRLQDDQPQHHDDHHQGPEAGNVLDGLLQIVGLGRGVGVFVDADPDMEMDMEGSSSTGREYGAYPARLFIHNARTRGMSGKLQARGATLAARQGLPKRYRRISRAGRRASSVSTPGCRWAPS